MLTGGLLGGKTLLLLAGRAGASVQRWPVTPRPELRDIIHGLSIFATTLFIISAADQVGGDVLLPPLRMLPVTR